MAAISRDHCTNERLRTRNKPQNEDVFILYAVIAAAALLLALLMPSGPEGLNMLQMQQSPAHAPDVVIRVHPDRQVADTRRVKQERNEVQPVGWW